VTGRKTDNWIALTMSVYSALCVFALHAWIATATTYFISPTGNDAATGTSESSPWQSAKRASEVVFSGGDAVLFEGDVVHDFTSVGQTGLTVRASTSSVGTIQIGSYGGAPAQIIADATKFDAIIILNTGGVEICNVTVANNEYADPSRISQCGIHVLSTSTISGPRFSDVYIHDVAVHGFMYGIAVDAFSGCQGFQGVRIVRALATNCTNTGISSQGSYDASCYSHADISVLDSAANFNQGVSTNTNSWSGSGIVLSGVDGALISHCGAYLL
jgi:hypothetical protein